MSALDIRDLHLAYGSTVVLDGLDLTVANGQVVSVLGPSGCGKTTLLRVIAGFERPSGGSVAIGDVAVAGPGLWVPPERRRLGIVPQEGALFPHLDVGDNVGFGLPRRQTHRNRDARIAEALELVGLGGYERRRPDQLSGGQQQRVALARALAPEPSIVLLDEPFSALDSGLRAQLRDEVRRVLAIAGATALIVTHDQEEALSMADAVAVLDQGRVAQIADPVTLYRRPATLSVAKFVGDAVVLSGERHGRLLTTALGELVDATPASDAITGPVTVVVRPEQIIIETDTARSGVNDAATGVRATVVCSTFFGRDASVQLRLADGTLTTARFGGRDVLVAGQRVTVRVEGSAVAFSR